MKEKVILAYNGGVTTSLCIDYLANVLNLEVIVYMADLSGRKDIHTLSKEAYKLGASQVHFTDLSSYLLEEVAFRALLAGAEFANGSFLARAIGSIIIVKGLANIAIENGINVAAQGSAIASNEQMRFENLLASLNPEMQFISPVREWSYSSRQEKLSHLLELLGRQKIGTSKDREYSLDENLWGTTFSFGPLTGNWTHPPEEMYRITQSPRKSPYRGEEVEITFEHGFPVAVNGKEMTPIEFVEELNILGGEHSIGRIELVSDGLSGIKLRQVCEYPGAKILYEAHRALEAVILPRKVLQHQEIMSIRYGELIMHGDWFTELRVAIDSYFKQTQQRVSGTVKMLLRKGVCTPISRKTPHILIPKPPNHLDKMLKREYLEGHTRLSSMLNRIEAQRNSDVHKGE